MKILHILDHYKPYFSGYVFRTGCILRYQREFGIEPVCITSPKHWVDGPDLQEFDDVKVYKTSTNSFGNLPFIKEAKLMNALQKRIEEIISIEKPDIIHAHSPSLNGIPSLRAGRKHGIPVAYEVRALWEDAAVDHGTFREGSFKYKVSRFIETELVKRVDALFTICEGLKSDIISRGISADKITVIPNCVDTEHFSLCKPDEEIKERYSLRNRTVYGFIGSFYHYEGIDLLLESYRNTLLKKSDTKLLLVGGGPAEAMLYKKADKMGLLDYVVFTGKVPHEQVKRFYSVIDILVYPRKSMRLTELVTPLKPLEAMAMGKIVVGSDVGGIKELIAHNKDGFLFKAGDADALSKLLTELASSKETCQEISKSTIETVHKKHKWELAIKRYLPIYEGLIKKSD